MNPFRFAVSLRITSQNTGLHELCAQLRMTPSRIWTIGEPRTNPKGDILDGINAESYCSIRMNPESDTESLSEMLHRIASGLINNKNAFIDIRKNGGRVEFFIGWFSPKNSGDVFEYNLLKLLGNMGIDLAFDIYSEAREKY